MRQQLVDADLLFPYRAGVKVWAALQALLFLFLSPTSFSNKATTDPAYIEIAQGDYVEIPKEVPLLVEGTGYVARIQTNSPTEVLKTLQRAEQLFEEGSISDDLDPIAFVLHGPEVAIFFKENYRQYREIVDLAAKLSAFEVIDVKVCETRMSLMGEQSVSLPPFVGTVPFGPAEIDRLRKRKNYLNF